MTSSGGTAVTQHRYGPAPAQAAELLLPASLATDPRGGPTRGGVAVLVHGGYWKAGYDRSLEDAVAADLLDRGVPVWNVDYRAATADGGGWPGTLEDVAAACDLLVDVAAERGLDARRTALVGHSAGGQLALWAAGRRRLPADAPGAGPRLLPLAVVSQAGVDDLVDAASRGLGDGAVPALLGGTPEDVPDRYALASPTALLPLGLPVLAVTGTADVNVPPDQTTSFAAAARAAGDDVTLEVVDGEDHFAHLDPASRCWEVARGFVLRHLG